MTKLKFNGSEQRAIQTPSWDRTRTRSDHNGVPLTRSCGLRVVFRQGGDNEEEDAGFIQLERIIPALSDDMIADCAWPTELPYHQAMSQEGDALEPYWC